MRNLFDSVALKYRRRPAAEEEGDNTFFWPLGCCGTSPTTGRGRARALRIRRSWPAVNYRIDAKDAQEFEARLCSAPSPTIEPPILSEPFRAFFGPDPQRFKIDPTLTVDRHRD
jgi:hypothetical protein